jgi:hypothetical protein
VTKTTTTTPQRSTVTKTTTVTPARSTVTKTTTDGKVITSVVTTTPAQSTADTITAIYTVTETEGSVCTVTKTASSSFYTSADHVTYSPQPTFVANKRDYPLKPSIPKEMSTGCTDPKKPITSRISSACSCFLTSKTITSTKTTTKTVTLPSQYAMTTVKTVTAATQPAVTVTKIAGATSYTTSTFTADSPPATTPTLTVTSPTFVTTCSETSTTTTNIGKPLTCGVVNPSTTIASGTISCSGVLSPTATNALLRIEGNSNDGTIFEGCVTSGPMEITTPSGGTHKCDGTNLNHNPSPGGTLTTLIQSAGELLGFDFDGTFSQTFDDFFITRIGRTAQTSSQFWGVLQNRQYTSVGGCQEQLTASGENLWAFDAFNQNSFLKVTPDYAVVRAGEGASSVAVTVLDESDRARSGAVIGGQTSDANGKAEIAVPSQPGCYQFKAERSGCLRSNTFYLTVLEAVSGGEGDGEPRPL